MATYEELRLLFHNDTLRHKVRVAVIIAAEAQLAATPGSATGRAWALSVIRNPSNVADQVLLTVIAANKAATVAQITGASDAQIQSNVEDVIVGLMNAEAGI